MDIIYNGNISSEHLNGSGIFPNKQAKSKLAMN